MGQINYYAGGTQPSEVWDDPSQTYTAYSQTGTVISTRPYTAAEQAQATALATAVTAGTNKATMQQQAQTAITNNQTYLAIVSPTNAQVVAQVQALTQQNNKIIRLLLGKLDATN